MSTLQMVALGVGILVFLALAFEVYRYVRGHPQALSDLQAKLKALEGQASTTASADWALLHNKLDNLRTQLTMVHAAVQAPVQLVVADVKPVEVAAPAASTGAAGAVAPLSTDKPADFSPTKPADPAPAEPAPPVQITLQPGWTLQGDFGLGGNAHGVLGPAQTKDKAISFTFNVLVARSYTVSADTGAAGGIVNWCVEQAGNPDVLHTDRGNASGTNPPAMPFVAGPATMRAWINPGSSQGMRQGGHAAFAFIPS